jgi:hypothetical protein
MSSFFVSQGDKTYWVASADGNTYVYKQCTGDQPKDGPSDGRQQSQWHLGADILVHVAPNRSFTYIATDSNATVTNITEAQASLGRVLS